MSQIDWSKAPEGATHFDCREYVSPAFMRKNHNGRDWEYFGMSHWIMYGQLSADQADKLIARPKGWTGEGLPPVGTVCELSSQGAKWGIGTIQYTAENVVVWRWENQAEGQACACYKHEVSIRPVRTPEQIAAELREKGIEGIRKAVSSSPNCKAHGLDWDVAGAIYDAGYRKQDEQ